jgi:hypothetical protein
MSAAPILRRPVRRAHLAVVLAGMFLSACAGQGDIDRVQPDAIDKLIFFNEDGSPRLFYYRETITGLPPTSAYAFEGMMGEMSKIRFDIQEKFLIGYRSYDYATGSQNPTTGGDNNKDTPTLIFPITGHFDVKREYNPATGEETNVISENTSDRPWDQRQYMRIDWSRNQAVPLESIDPMTAFLSGTRTNGIAITEQEDPLFNTNRPIFTRDYIDFSRREIRSPDLLACYRLFGADDEIGPWGCGDAELTFRSSLMPVPDSEYEPLSFPDRQILKDEQGKPLRMANGAYGPIACTPAKLKEEGLSGDDCTEASLDQFSKFGYFRTAIPTYDRQVGATQEGRQYYANRWNIWKETIQKGSDGQPLTHPDGSFFRIPYSQRQTRTITYYMNPEFPEDPKLRDMARQTVDDWNQAMKETVAGLNMTANDQTPSLPQLKAAAASLPDIIKLEPNSCSISNVKAFVEANPDVRSMVEKRDTGKVLDFDDLQAADLLKACTALEVVTQSRKDGDTKHPKFTWQRNGDLRYSFLHWVDRPQVGGPLGYGPSSQDPETGEIVSAAAYIYGAALDTYAKFATDSVRLANGQLSTDDLLSGKTISDVLKESAAAATARNKEKMTDAAKNMIRARLSALGKTQDERLRKVSVGIDDQPMQKIRGTAAEKLLLNDDVLPAVIAGYRPGDPVPADVFDQAMKKPWLSSQTREERRARFQTLAGKGGCVYMADFADDAILGTALELDKLGLSQDEMFKELRARIFRGLADHEVGHTVGLRHNFSSSSDALNYLDDFWRVRQNFPENSWESEHKLSELAYASVMDYGARFNSDVHGLGKYDSAAIRFGYGQMIDLIVNSKISAYTGLRSAIALDDYSLLPFDTGGIATFDTAATTVMPYQAFIDHWTTQFRAVVKNGTGDITVFRERPYKFCEDLFEGNLDCKTWDRGANQQEMVSNVTEQFRNYYAFNAYKRGRQNWSIDSYLNRLQERYFNRYSEAFQFFFFLSDYMNYDLGMDLFLASVQSLNSIAAILQTPEPGLHCATATSPTVATYPVDSLGYLDPSLCLPNQPKLDVQIPDAKPFYINFSDDYYYTFTRVGSLLEKLQALSALTSTESRFFRVDELSDVAARSSINYYRLFRDEVVKLLGGVIRNDHSQYGATIGGTMAAPTLVPMPVVDPKTFGELGASPAYSQPGTVHVLTPVNRSIRYWALLFGLGRLGSTWDFTLDFQNFLAIGVKGSDDDFVVGSGTAIEFTHPETGLVFRAPSNSAGAAPNIGRQILDELNAITGVSGTRGTIPTSIDSYTNGNPLPNWYTAKADLDAAAALPKNDANQDKYSEALSTFNYINYLLGYRIDLIADVRMFRKLLLLP